MVDREAIRQRWELVGSKLDERGQRHFAAVEAMTAGRGGIVAVQEITGIARSTIGRGLDELDGAAVAHGGGGAGTGSPTSIRRFCSTLSASSSRSPWAIPSGR